MEAVQKHDARQAFSKSIADPINTISGSLKDFNIDDDGFSQRTTSQATTFATQFSACSNQSFNKLINNFRVDSAIQKEMLAILAALTEVIKEKGGKETNTEYFLALMETIENAQENSDIKAALMLLNMGIKSVPEAVLQAKFTETSSMLIELIARFIDSDDINVIKTIISCLSVVLRAQQYSCWESSSTMKFLDSILTFTIHTKPKIRKSAQHAIGSILYGSVFMLPEKKETDEFDEEEMQSEPPKIVHPAASRVARFCVDQFKPEIISNNQTLLFHILALLQSVLAGNLNKKLKFFQNY
jgi:ribosomal RNA-processing protein 12